MKRRVLLLATIVTALLVATGVAWAATVIFTQGENVAVGDGPNSVTSADFNGDSERDLAVGNVASDNISVVLGNGDGTFGLPQNYGAGVFPQDILSVDFNGDGSADLAVANSITSEVSVLVGNGDGTFGARQSYAVAGGPRDLSSADFNSDGNADLAAANFDGSRDPSGTVSHELSVLLGNGDGSFQAAQNIPTGSCPWGIDSADFNNDGHADLVTANTCPEGGRDISVYVHLGNGDGSFGEAQDFQLGSGRVPGDIINVDFNDDGNQDIAVSGSGSVVVLVGNGDGTFQDPQNFAAEDDPRGLTSADFDGDTKADVAVGNRDSDSVSVLLGNGDGTLQDPQNFGAGDAPVGLTNADFNGDIKPDLAVANVVSDDVSVLLNAEVPPPDTSGDGVVTNTADSGAGSLRQEIIHANSTTGVADTISFKLGSAATISLTSAQLPTITDGAGLTIDGGSADITVSGGNRYRVFEVGSGAKLTLSNLTVAHGGAAFKSGAGIYNGGGTLEVSNSTLSDNSAPNDGGAIYNSNGTVTVSNSTLSGNTVPDSCAGGGFGAGIYNGGGTLEVSNSTLSGNSAPNGSGIFDTTEGGLRSRTRSWLTTLQPQAGVVPGPPSTTAATTSTRALAAASQQRTTPNSVWTPCSATLLTSAVPP